MPRRRVTEDLMPLENLCQQYAIEQVKRHWKLCYPEEHMF
jgi:hypothetical protein